MKKSIKGAIAASAAGVLLLGGAGSLAYWTAEGDVKGRNIDAGELKLSDGACDRGWKYAAGPNAGNAVTLFVPGDQITQTCTFTLLALGDNLAATLGVPESVVVGNTPDASAMTVTSSATFQITSGAPATTRTVADGATVTQADDEGVITATFNVTIPYGTADADPDVNDPTAINGNATQNIMAALDDLTVTLTQVNPDASVQQ